MKNNSALFYTCSLIEFIGRQQKLPRCEVVRALGEKAIARIYAYADVFHCEPIEKTADDFITMREVPVGDFDNGRRLPLHGAGLLDDRRGLCAADRRCLRRRRGADHSTADRSLHFLDRCCHLQLQYRFLLPTPRLHLRLLRGWRDLRVNCARWRKSPAGFRFSGGENLR